MCQPVPDFSKEWNETIIFLHKLVDGGTNRSYGVQVAALAGVPSRVVERAEEILKSIERGTFDNQTITANSTWKTGAKTRPANKPNQLSLFHQPSHPVINELKQLSIDDLTPREALEVLYKLHALLK